MDYQKVSPTLAALVDEYRTASPLAAIEAASMLGVRVRAAIASPVVPLFVRCDPDAPQSKLRGVKFHQRSGSVRTALVPLDKIDQLSERDDIQRLSPARTLRPLMDVAAARVGLGNLKVAGGLSGQGVVVGVIDSGIDATHPSLAGRIHS